MRFAPAAFLLLLLSAVSAQAEVIGREGKGWLERRDDGQLVLHLKGSPYEMGFQHGRLLADLVKANMERIADNKGALGESDEYTMYKMMRPMMHGQLRPFIPQRYLDEMRGLAEGAGVDYEMVEAGNLFPAAFHCSGIALKGKATHDGSLYHVRILDYLTEVGLQSASLVIVHEPDEGRRRWLNVGFAGFIGSVTGMNDAQVAIGEMGGNGLGYWDGMPMAFLIREALERGTTMEEALEIFRSTPRTCEYYYVISDGKTRDAIGLWCTPETVETMRPGENYAMFERLKPQKGAAGGKAFAGPLDVDTREHRILFKEKDGKVKGFMALQPEDSLVISGYDRYQHFIDRLLPNFGQVDETRLMDMVKRPVSMKSNLHVAIFHPETLEVWVAVADEKGNPACDQPYFRFALTQEEGPK
jgi:predicted choloylglycine hydrolase